MSSHMARMGWYQIRQKPSGKWEARWATYSGALKAASFLSKQQARTYAVNQAMKVMDVKAGITAPTKDIAEAADAFCARADKNDKTHDINRRVVDWFIKVTGVNCVHDITEAAFNKVIQAAKERTKNPGGQNHLLKHAKAFVAFCIRNKWLRENPIPADFHMPQPIPSLRPLSEDQFEQMMTIRPNYEERDTRLAEIFLVGRYTMARTQTVFNFSSDSFRNNATEVFLPGVKRQEPKWVPLHEKIQPLVLQLLARVRPHQRLFSYWPNIGNLQDHITKKAAWMGLPGISFHDICKATQVNALRRAGVRPDLIASLCNTTEQTLYKYYFKLDQAEAFRVYKDYDHEQTIVTDHKRGLAEDQTTPTPQNRGFAVLTSVNGYPPELKINDKNSPENQSNLFFRQEFGKRMKLTRYAQVAELVDAYV